MTDPQGAAHDGSAPRPVPGWPAIATRGLHKRFGANVAVGSLDLDVPVGSFFGLVGPNGSGKTTTLRMVAGLLRPDSGQVWVGGHDTWADTLTVRRLIGVVPDPLNLVSFACSQGTPVGSFCEVGSIASGASVIATLVATPITNPARSERKFTNTAFISESGTTDPNAGNDTATLDLHISGKTP